ncbi:MAG: UvrD-helicase domain-containing protein [Gammaproteobacteria bacterium]
MNITDLSQRQQALECDKSFIVQAPAGSGKTTLLTQRILRLLSIVKKPEEILAITFTKKAANEMRDRVIAALQNATEEYAKQALAQDKKQGWNLLENPNRLQIKTIDSLCHSLAQQMPMLSSFGTITKTTDDAKPLYLKAAHELLMQINSNEAYAFGIKQLLLHLNNEFNKAQKLIADMLVKRDQWLPHVYGQKISREDLEQSLQSITNHCLEKLNNTLPPNLAQEVKILAEFAKTNMDPAVKPRDDVAINMDPAVKPRDDITEEIDYWQFVAKIFLTDKNTWRKKFTKNEGFPASNKPMKQRVSDLLQQFSMHGKFREALIEIKIIPPTKYSEQQWQTLESLIILLPRAAAFLKLVFQEVGEVDFIEVAQAAKNALGLIDNPTDLALFLDYKIKHILVDEFQDTSISQFKLLESLTTGWEKNDGRTLFIVGDPMQSIYRFREARVGLFIRARQYGIGNIKLHSITLSTNFRSSEKLINWFNQIFTDVFPQVENITDGAVKYNQAKSFHENAPDACIKIHTSSDANEVVKLIKSLKQQDAQQKIAILVRSRSNLAEILPALQNHNLTYQAIEIDKLNTNPIIQDLLALTRALLNPADKIAWLAILRAPWCGLSLKDLYFITNSSSRGLTAGSSKKQNPNLDPAVKPRDDEHDKTVWQSINDPNILQKIDVNAQQNLLFLREQFDKALQNRGRKNLRDFIYDSWLSINGNACLNKNSDIEDVKTYFKLLETFDTGGDIKNFNQFEEKIKALSTSPAATNDDTLQIMTIHKAKGLEFDTVILPNLHRIPKSDDKQLLLWDDQPGTEYGDELIFAPIKNYAEQKDKIYNYLEEHEKQKKHFEVQRLLYVAMTRAKHQLHLFGTAEPNKKPDKRSLLNLVWPQVKEEFENIEAAQQTNNMHKTSPKLKRIVREQTIKQSLDPVFNQLDCKMTVPVPPNHTNAHLGTVIHRILQQIAIDGIDKWPEKRIQNSLPYWQNMLIQLGVSSDDLKYAKKQIELVLKNILTDSRAQWILKNRQEHRNEFAISTTQNNQLEHYRIDRTFIDQNKRWIIDYKTTIFSGKNIEKFIAQEKTKHQQQLMNYQQLLMRLYSEEISCGLYYPAIPLWIEL